MNESSKFPTIFFFVVVVILVVPILAVGVYKVYQNFYNGSQETPAEEIILPEPEEEVSDPTYSLIDELFQPLSVDLDAIFIPPPPDSATEDAAHYKSVKPEVGTLTSDDVLNDTVYNFVIRDSTYGELINSGSDASFEMYQYHDELRDITKKYNDMYDRQPLSKRISGVEEIGAIEPAVFGDESHSVYPSVRAVEGFLVGEVLAQSDPDNAVLHREAGEAYAMRGIVYGHYGLSDVEASRLLVNQYFQIADGIKGDTTPDLETN